jgi:outer membrane receptor protein involved in Fe transport
LLSLTSSTLAYSACSALVLVAPRAARGQQPPTSPCDSIGRNAVARDSATRRLAPVTVTATPAERAAPASATHVDAPAIHQTPAESPYDLLRQTAGMEVHEQGQGPGFASDASLRGFSSDHATDIALWIDGVPVNEPVNGHAEGYNDWNVLFPAAVHDVDVIRGPTSALFGNFALAGVVNVRTLERLRGTEATASGGSFGLAEGTLLTGFDHGAEGGGVLGLRYQREDGFRPNGRYGLLQGHGRLVHDLSRSARLDGGVELYGGDWHSPGFLSEDEFSEHAFDVVSNPTDGGDKRRAQERMSLRVLSGNLLWRSTAYATQGRWQLFLTIPPAGGRFEGSGSQTEEEDRRTGYGATSAATWALSRGEVTLGGETRWDESHYQNYFTTDRRRDSVATLVTGRQLAGALFIQSHTDVSDRLRLDAGARYDAFDTRSAPGGDTSATGTHGVVSPKLGALLRLTPAFGVYGNVSRGFRTPDGVIEDPTRVPITAWSYEGGVKLASGDAFASAALFRMDVSNEQTFNPVTLVATSGGASRRQGLELDWRVPLGAVPDAAATLSGDWTFNDARYRSLTAVPEAGDDEPVVLDGLRVYNTSKYVGQAAIEVVPLARASGSSGVPSTSGLSWRVRVGATFNGPYSPFDEPGVVLGGYALLHLSGVVQLRRLEMGAGVRNVLDRRYPELVAGHVVAPGQPRALRLTLRVFPEGAPR